MLVNEICDVISMHTNMEALYHSIDITIRKVFMTITIEHLSRLENIQSPSYIRFASICRFIK